MSIEAQNCLLKTLEEPPGRTCLILVTSSASRLLPTIRSRCQIIPFGLLPPAFVREQLAALAKMDARAAAALAGLSQGRLGAAVQWHRIDLLATVRELGGELNAGLTGSPENFGKRLIMLATDLIARTKAAERAEATTGDDDEGESDADEQDGAEEADDGEVEASAAKGGAKKVATDELRDALRLVLLVLSVIYRDVLVSRVVGPGAQTPRLLPAGLVALERIGDALDAEALGDAIGAIAAAERMIARNVAPQLACERLAIALTGEAAHV